MSTLQDFEIGTLGHGGNLIPALDGQVILMVNVASKCGLTPQYAGLQKLHDDAQGEGLTVLGLPCNQFGGQEPGTPDEILEFCDTNYAVSFPLTDKIDVNGATQHPIYAWLTGADGAFPGDIEWNFEKFLVDRQGQVVKRYPPATPPDDPGLLRDIADLL
jgi:glutathione peroxidase